MSADDTQQGAPAPDGKTLTAAELLARMRKDRAALPPREPEPAPAPKAPSEPKFSRVALTKALMEAAVAGWLEAKAVAEKARQFSQPNDKASLNAQAVAETELIRAATTKNEAKKDYEKAVAADKVEKARAAAGGVSVGDDDDDDDKDSPDDIGNADIFLATYGEDMCRAEGVWFVWDGKRWVADENDEQAPQKLYVFAKELKALGETPGEVEAARRAKRLHTAAGFAAALKLAPASPEVKKLKRNDFDAAEYQTTVNNGTIDLLSGALSPHERSNYCSRMVDIPHVEGSTCFRWLRLLEDVFGGDKDVISYIQRVFGYCLTGSTKEHALFILHGSGSNGKSTFIRILQAICGEFAWTTPISTLLRAQGAGGDNASPSVAALAGARCVTSSESGRGKALDEALVKQLTGSDRITARFLHQNQFQFDPRFKILMATNHKPVIRDMDPAIWRRLHLIPFDAVFADKGTREYEQALMLGKTPKPKDPTLDADLDAEMSGILAWALAGTQAWAQNGLRPPAAVSDAVTAYRNEENTIGRFIADWLVDEKDDEKAVGVDELRMRYVEWAKLEGETALSQRELKAALEAAGLTQSRTKKRRFWVGQRLRTPQDELRGAGDKQQQNKQVLPGAQQNGQNQPSA